MKTRNEIISAARAVMSSVHARGYDAVRETLKKIIEESKNQFADDVQLQRFLAKEYLVGTAFFLGPLRDMEESLMRVREIGFANNYQQINCLLIVAAWCEDSRYLEKASGLVLEAENYVLTISTTDPARSELENCITRHKCEIRKLQLSISKESSN